METMSPESDEPLHVVPPLKKCICQLCSCGCHRCPHLPSRLYDKTEKPCVLSEYKEQYPLHPITAPEGSFKPKAVYKVADIRMEGTSTTKRDYIAKEVLPRKLVSPQKHVKSDETMDCTTTYKQDYHSYLTSRLPPCLPSETKHIPNVKMNTRTTYEDDYVLWNEQKTDLIRPDNRFRPSELKFDHRTIFQDDYLYRGPVATRNFKPPNQIQKTKAPEYITNYRVNYVPHPPEKHYVHKKEKYKANEIPFDGLTTHKVSYKWMAGQPAKLAKPCQSKYLNNIPFSSTTEFQEKYQAWPRASIFTKKPVVYLPPLEKMDLQTTTKIHYKHPNGKPTKTCQPVAQIPKSTGSFNSSSTMKEDYKPWLCKRLKPIIHAPELTFSAKPMDCLTTFQTHYVPHLPTVTKSYKPPWSGPKDQTPLQAKTIYTTSYTPKDFVRCLASYKHPPGYIFEGTNADGHSLYLPASKSRVLAGLTQKEEESGHHLGNGFKEQDPSELRMKA
ncbi:stabilizer of axonemal microtubules 1 [Pezoporus occidentalis]|uniref:stabilizer of axonemal microtubules 1 n=1 Tax=Pezoporus occidentalis TaxID=407982 RepID=UPI002F906A77